MKFTYIILVLAILGGSYWLLTDKEVANTDSSDKSPKAEVTTKTKLVTAGENGSVTEKVFDVDSFAFGYSVTEIRVKKGDTVKINLTNSGGFHNWVVDEFSAATEAISAGGNTSVTFVADKADYKKIIPTFEDTFASFRLE